MQYHIIDAFTDRLFGGNPAGVCLLDEWPPNETLQNIAAENNLSETAFLVSREDYYELRWFTPRIEVKLCGHATLASAFVLFEEAEPAANALKFKTLSGMLTVTRGNGIYYLDFPARPAEACPVYEAFERAFGVRPAAVYKALDFVVLLNGEETLNKLTPDFAALKRLKAEAKLETDDFGIIVTAESGEYDFVSRFFAPNVGIDEDPVTGRAFCSLIPFWSERLNKTVMKAKQISKRGGVVYCEARGERVKIGGGAVRYLRGEIETGGKP